MEYLLLGFLTGLSLILAIGAQNIFVIEQGLKKQYVFLVCLICSLSDLILIFLGIFLFQFFSVFFNSTIELILNILLFIFLVHFIYGKISIQKNKINFNQETKSISLINIITKTLAFTYLNPHVYSDTVFFLGNFSKNLFLMDKYYFGIGASIASFLFFFFDRISLKIVI
jgi:L-lysine exporter family protein LysE/ArgO